MNALWLAALLVAAPDVTLKLFPTDATGTRFELPSGLEACDDGPFRATAGGFTFAAEPNRDDPSATPFLLPVRDKNTGRCVHQPVRLFAEPKSDLAALLERYAESSTRAAVAGPWVYLTDEVEPKAPPGLTWCSTKRRLARTNVAYTLEVAKADEDCTKKMSIKVVRRPGTILTVPDNDVDVRFVLDQSVRHLDVELRTANVPPDTTVAIVGFGAARLLSCPSTDRCRYRVDGDFSDFSSGTVLLGSRTVDAHASAAFLDADGQRIEPGPRRVSVSTWQVDEGVSPTVAIPRPTGNTAVVSTDGIPVFRLVADGPHPANDSKVRVRGAGEVEILPAGLVPLRDTSKRRLEVSLKLRQGLSIYAKDATVPSTTVEAQFRVPDCAYTIRQVTTAFSNLTKGVAVFRLQRKGSEGQCPLERLRVTTETDGVVVWSDVELVGDDLAIVHYSATANDAEVRAPLAFTYASGDAIDTSGDTPALVLAPLSGLAIQRTEVAAPTDATAGVSTEKKIAVGRPTILFFSTAATGWDAYEIVNAGAYTAGNCERPFTTTINEEQAAVCAHGPTTDPLRLRLRRKLDARRWRGAPYTGKNPRLTQLTEETLLDTGVAASKVRFALNLATARLVCRGPNPKVLLGDWVSRCRVELPVDGTLREDLKAYGEQKLKLVVRIEREKKMEPTETLLSLSAGRTHGSATATVAVFPLEGRATDPGPNKRVSIELHHATPTDYIDDGAYSYPNTSMIRGVRTPGRGVGIDEDGNGYRVSLGVTAGTLYRFPSSGDGATKSSEVRFVEEVALKAGFAGTIECYRFDEDRTWSTINPVLIGAVLLMDNDDLVPSLAGGIGVRLAGEADSDEKVASTPLLALMGEIAYRFGEGLQASFLVGLNITVGATVNNEKKD